MGLTTNNGWREVNDSLILVSNNQFNEQISKKILQPFKNLTLEGNSNTTGDDILLKYTSLTMFLNFSIKYCKENLAALIFFKTDFNSF